MNSASLEFTAQNKAKTIVAYNKAYVRFIAPVSRGKSVVGAKVELDIATAHGVSRQTVTVSPLDKLEENRIMRLLIERVQLHEDGLDIIWRDDSWQRFCRELERHQFVAEQRAPVEMEVVE